LVAEVPLGFAGSPLLVVSNAIQVVSELLQPPCRVPVVCHPVIGRTLVPALAPPILQEVQSLQLGFQREPESGRRMIAKVWLAFVVAPGQVPASLVDVPSQLVELGSQLVDSRTMVVGIRR
jgi:hypothetical protein